MTVDIYTLGTDTETDELIAILRLALGVAQEAEIAHPQTISALRMWCNTEYRRLHVPTPIALTPEQEVKMALQRSPYWRFWETLEADQEVRWTGAKSATYFVVDPNPVFTIPDDDNTSRHAPGMFIELRRHTGKTFWTHIGKVRPLDNTEEA